MQEKKAKEEFELDPTTLPWPLIEVVHNLNQIQRRDTYQREAEHYWEQACNSTAYTSGKECIYEAVHNLRMRFSNVLE